MKVMVIHSIPCFPRFLSGETFKNLHLLGKAFFSIFFQMTKPLQSTVLYTLPYAIQF